jgi:hypothetical protein
MCAWTTPPPSGVALVRGGHWPRTGAACPEGVSAHPGDDRSAGPLLRSPESRSALFPEPPRDVKGGSGKQDEEAQVFAPDGAAGCKIHWGGRLKLRFISS